MISTLEDYNNKRPSTGFVVTGKKPSEYIADCYSILNMLCALGNVKKMYVPKCVDNKKSLKENQELYEKEIAYKLKCKKGGKILELGSGCGRIAYHMSNIMIAPFWNKYRQGSN